MPCRHCVSIQGISEVEGSIKKHKRHKLHQVTSESNRLVDAELRRRRPSPQLGFQASILQNSYTVEVGGFKPQSHGPLGIINHKCLNSMVFHSVALVLTASDILKPFEIFETTKRSDIGGLCGEEFEAEPVGHQSLGPTFQRRTRPRVPESAGRAGEPGANTRAALPGGVENHTDRIDRDRDR